MYEFFHQCILLLRNVNNIRGFTRETLVALAAIIESREWRRQNAKNRILAEHIQAYKEVLYVICCMQLGIVLTCHITMLNLSIHP